MKDANTKPPITHIAVALEGCNNAIVMVIVGQSGWTPLTAGAKSLQEADAWVVRTHHTRRPDEAERTQALRGAIFGWDKNPLLAHR